ncbi:MAG: hypothetical protein ACJAVF_002210, partial [Paraglaciecola sp.]
YFGVFVSGYVQKDNANIVFFPIIQKNKVLFLQFSFGQVTNYANL